MWCQKVSAVLFAATTAVMLAQRPGNGISKQTYAGNDPQGFIDWISLYFPVTHCGWNKQQCNSSSADCGQIGRLNLCPESGACGTSSMGSLMFHMVNTSARPSGPTTVAEVDAAFHEKMTAAFRAQRYDAFMDFALVVWATDLDAYLRQFVADGVGFLALEWSDETSAAYYSVVVHVPRTQVVVELISSQRPTAATLVQDATVRYHSEVFSNMGASTAVSSDRFRPLAISKASSDLDALTEFYEEALFANATHKRSYPDGTRIAIFNPGFSSMSGKMSVRFVERPPAMTSPGLSVRGLEEIKFAGHDWAHDDKGNLSANCVCGFSKWYDNHYGIDGGSATLDEYKAAFDKRGWAYYHAWAGHPGPENLYVVDPTGDSMQLDSRWVGPPPAGISGDALQSMCSQGNCQQAMNPTPAACASALAATCPGLARMNSACSDCVYGAKNHEALWDAGCLNADMVSYCLASPSAASDLAGLAV